MRDTIFSRLQLSWLWSSYPWRIDDIRVQHDIWNGRLLSHVTECVPKKSDFALLALPCPVRLQVGSGVWSVSHQHVRKPTNFQIYMLTSTRLGDQPRSGDPINTVMERRTWLRPERSLICIATSDISCFDCLWCLSKLGSFFLTYCQISSYLEMRAED